MRVLKCEIEIGAFTFDFVTDLEIVSSWELLTDTCTITLPKNLRYRGTDGKLKKNIIRGTEAIFKRGDTVKIKAGYYPSPEFGELVPYNVIFEGYVLEVSPKRPLTIKCEDSAYILKRMRITNYSSEDKPTDLDFTLKDVASQVNSNAGGVKFEYDIKAEIMDIGETILENITYADFLDMLKRKFNLNAYIRKNPDTQEETLYVGFARITQNNNDNVFSLPNVAHTLQFGRDIISDSNLTYRNAADIDINVTCISIDKNNKRVSASAGQPWGSARNLYYYHDLNTNETTDEPLPSIEKAMQKIADESVATFKFNGYRGSFTVFGIPNVNHGDSVIIENGDIEDTSGEYILEKVVKRFGQNGFKQEIYLSARINRG